MLECMKRIFTLGFLLATLVSGFAAETVKTKLNLLEAIKSGAVEYHVNPKSDVHDDPKDIWKFQPDGNLHISGRGYGYVATKESFRDYHLVLEFKWGAKTWGSRETKARDNGILLHAYGPHGAYGGSWMASIECQIIEGGVGDILVLSPKLEDGTKLTTSLSAEIALDRDKEKIWKKGEPRQEVTSGRVNWGKRDVDWADIKGFRGREDVESPMSEWNRLEVIAKGDTLQYFVNGALVNEAFDCKPSEGKVLLQTEAAEMIVRRYELYPLGEFKEKWSAIQASGGSDVMVRAGQDQPMSPEESMKLIQLDGAYEVQLVAAEPLVLDPVEVTWDARGRLFVADMRDYPLGPPNAGDPWLSRIQMLTDEDGDGRMDKAVTFADHLDHVQGLLPYNDGLIATTRTQILFLRDTDGDGKADESRPLIKGFNPRHSQLQVSSPRWGPDNCVHFNNGLEAKEIYPADNPSDVVNVPRSNFKWDPRTGSIEPTGGLGQYGGAFDDWGHHFYCSNRNPLMFTVMPYAAMMRNPRSGIEKNYEDIAPAGADTRVFPLKITHTTADAHAGTNTSCSGLGVYRGGLMPELKNNVFVPDPTGQLITRYRIEPHGASLKATRIGERTEFFRSAEEWCRPVNFTTGPDGAIYVCDIYRRWIDHARFFPEEFVKTHDMRQGENHGRIWRIVPKGKIVPKIEPAPKETESLRAWLNHENAWQRETAQRLLLERGELPDRPLRLKEHAQRITFEKLLSKADAEGPPDRELVALRVAAISAAPEDPWIAKAVLASSTHTPGIVLDELLQRDDFTRQFSGPRSQTVRALTNASAAAGRAEGLQTALKPLLREPSTLVWWQSALLQGLAEGLPKSGGKLGVKSLADFIAKPPPPFTDTAAQIGLMMGKIESTAKNPKAQVATRLAVLPLLAQSDWARVEPVVRGILTSNPGAELSQAALGLMKTFGARKTSALIYELLPAAGPTVRRDLIAMLTANGATALALFQRMEKGEFSPALVDVETRWRYQRGTGELRDLAVKLFGQPSTDRAAVLASYMESITMKGDAQKGRQVFATVCIACHKIGNLGLEVGPPLSDLKVKPPEALLSDILDPNRMIEARWSAYQLDTQDGRVLVGLITAENAESVTLTMMGGVKESIQRSNIKEMRSLDHSLMPVGLEGAISKEQMADLITFLKEFQ